MGKKTALVILDGWGHGSNEKSNAIYCANTPFVDSLYDKYPNTELLTHGEFVGLPKGQMGNSEVGHLNIGAGRVVNQNLVRINNACNDNSISEQKALKDSFSYVKEHSKALHLIGLLSDGGIHSHQNHLHKLCKIANRYNITNVYIHVFTDGRDTDPNSSIKFIRKLESNLFGAKIASVCGRYYAMDRDNRWERTRIAYDLIVNGKGKKSKNAISEIQSSYNDGVTDEFIKPIVMVDSDDNPIGMINDKDAVICFNFRTDRCRQITSVLTQNDLLDFGMKTLDLHYTTMTSYDDTFKGINVIYEKTKLKNTLGEILSNNQKKQIRIAETEKYPHVTFFFSGGNENKFEGEKRLLIPSPKVSTYDLRPKMSAEKLKSSIINEFKKQEADFICLNFANPDMVGHTGNYNAIIEAIEEVDRCLGEVVESALKNDYALIIISDHGNAEYTVNYDGSPNTAHTLNPVPCFIINTEYDYIKEGKLGDVAPTILKIMEMEIPKEMTGNILIK